MQADYVSITSFVNGQFTKSIAFFSTLGWQNAPKIFDIVGNPKLQIGVGAGADVINISNIDNLQLKALVASSNVDVPSVLPAPFPVATFRIGIINGLDVGAKLLYMPQLNVPAAGFSGQYTGWGVDMRYRILDRFPLPVIAVGTSWDILYGKTTINTSVQQNSTYTDSGTQYQDSITGDTNYDLDWNVKSFGARLIVGEDWGEFFPYAAVGFQRNSGWVRSTVTGQVTATINPNSSNFDINVQNSGQPVILEPKFILGFEVGEGFKWDVVGESNGSDIAGSTGFAVQF